MLPTVINGGVVGTDPTASLQRRVAADVDLNETATTKPAPNRYVAGRSYRSGVVATNIFNELPRA